MLASSFGDHPSDALTRGAPSRSPAAFPAPGPSRISTESGRDPVEDPEGAASAGICRRICVSPRGELRYCRLVGRSRPVEDCGVGDLPFAGKDRQFPETHWSQLLELGDPANPNYAPNLERLIHQYWMPVYHYVRSLRPVAPPEAEDLTQQFFTMLLDRGSFAKLAPERGSFRGFLKTALRYFLIDQDRTASAHAPRDGARFFPFDQAEASWKDARKGVPVSGPEEAFDQEWAR